MMNDHIFDFGNKDRVIAGIMRGMQSAFQVSQCAVKDGGAMGRTVKACAGFSLGLLMRSRGQSIVFRDHTLVFCQDVHSEALTGLKVGVGAGLVIYANEDQRRIERDRGESIGGHAMYFALMIDRDDRDSGGEAAQSLAKIGL